MRQSAPSLSISPVSEHINHRRVFTISQSRIDFLDALAQFTVLINQLHQDGFTGSITFNFAHGGINSVETNEHRK